MAIRVVNYYENEDTSFLGDNTTQVFDGDTLILSGDYYHNKVSVQLDTFLGTLPEDVVVEYQNIADTEAMWNTPFVDLKRNKKNGKTS